MTEYHFIAKGDITQAYNIATDYLSSKLDRLSADAGVKDNVVVIRTRDFTSEDINWLGKRGLQLLTQSMF